MRTVHHAGLIASIASVVAAAACGDTEPGCEARMFVRDQGDSRCVTAHELAKRGTVEIIPTQAELDAAAQLVDRAFEPLREVLATVPAAASWYQARAQVTWLVTNPGIATAWASGLGPTGDPTVDAVVAAMDVWDFELTPMRPEGHYATFQSRGAVSARNVAAAVAGVPGVEVYTDTHTGETASSDVVDEGLDPADGAHVMLFWVGWGDCMSGCLASHWWRTEVAPDGSASLVEEWGAPLPDGYAPARTSGVRFAP